MNGNSHLPFMGRPGFMPLQLPPPPPHALYSLANENMGRGPRPRPGFNQSFRGPSPCFNPPFRGMPHRGGFNQYRARSIPQKRKMIQEVDGGATPVQDNQVGAAGGLPGNDGDYDAKFYLPEDGAVGGENTIFKRRPKPWQNKPQRSNDGEPKPQLRCELCDLPLTSETHAEQHYKGRRHRLVASKISNPSGAGYYNEEGKWVRTATKFMPTVAPDGRFGIGEAFKKTDDAESTSIAVIPAKTVPDELCCKVCSITVTSKAHMDMHLIGVKHAKKLKQFGLNPITTLDETLAARTDKSLLATVIEGADGTTQDFSMYRTPAGGYYCKVCDLQLTHIMGLKQHLDGKKHQRIAAAHGTPATA